MSMKADLKKSSERKSDIIKDKLEIINLFQNNAISHLKLNTGKKAQFTKECLSADEGLQSAQYPNEEQLSPSIPVWEAMVTTFLEII